MRGDKLLRRIACEVEGLLPGRRSIPILGNLRSDNTVTVEGGPHLARLGSAFQFIARSIGGVVGVTALDLRTRESVSLNNGNRFPMASLVKVPLAVAAMKL